MKRKGKTLTLANFWVRARLDGKRTAVSAGPSGKDGGFDLAVAIRDDGKSECAVEMTGRTTSDGGLILRVNAGDAGTLRIDPAHPGSFVIETYRSARFRDGDPVEFVSRAVGPNSHNGEWMAGTFSGYTGNGEYCRARDAGGRLHLFKLNDVRRPTHPATGKVN